VSLALPDTGPAGGCDDVAGDNRFVACLIANTSSFDGEVDVTLYFEDGSTAQQRVHVKRTAGSTSRSVRREAMGGFGAIVRDRRFGAVLESVLQADRAAAAEIVVERAMYSSANGVWWSAGTNVIATKLR
jgi:hypothetical protein